MTAEPQATPSKWDRANVLWPRVSTLAEAQAACRTGAWGAVFVAVSTAVFALLAAAGVSVSTPVQLDAWALADAAVFAVCAWGVFRYSRVAAVSTALLYAVERGALLAIGGARGFGILPIILMLIFVGAIRGAFAYQRLLKTPVAPAPSVQ